MPCILRGGGPWRDLHERCGKWSPVTVRFRRWAAQGVWGALLETPVEAGPTDNWRHMVDSTMVRGHSQSAGAKGGFAGRALVQGWFGVTSLCSMSCWRQSLSNRCVLNCAAGPDRQRGGGQNWRSSSVGTAWMRYGTASTAASGNATAVCRSATSARRARAHFEGLSMATNGQGLPSPVRTSAMSR